LINLTELAARNFKRIREDEELSEDVPLRVSVKGGGCAGYEYVLTFGDANKKDLVLTIKKNQLAKDVENQRETRFTPGQKVDCLISKLDKKKREVSLSIKALEEKESKEALKKYGSEDSGMKLKDILGPLINKKKKN